MVNNMNRLYYRPIPSSKTSKLNQCPFITNNYGHLVVLWFSLWLNLSLSTSISLLLTPLLNMVTNNSLSFWIHRAFYGIYILMRRFGKRWTHHESITNWYRWNYSMKTTWMLISCKHFVTLAIGWQRWQPMLDLQLPQPLHVRAINCRPFMIGVVLAATAFSKHNRISFNLEWY